jgi:16S rRNA (cytosine967-C5)-methyltransferase
VQDEGSQLAALLSAAGPRETVIDLCAGGGGKTLALAAQMENRGRLVATDSDLRRLAPIHARLARAGAVGVEVRTPRGASAPLDDLAGQVDLVLIDAPCTGIGAWRRNPDAKWRVRPGALEQRIKDQDEVLARAAPLVRQGGRIAYITCSLLAEENGDRVGAFLAARPEFAIMPVDEMVRTLPGRGAEFGAAVLATAQGLLMTPRRTGTDGFFVAIMVRK